MRTGSKNQALISGRLAYGHDGTNAYVFWTDANGRIKVESIEAGNNRIGTVSGVYKEVQTTVAIDATGGAYTANDVVSDDDTASSGAFWTFAAVARANAAGGYITKANIQVETESVTPRMSLYLFHTAPTSELDDNAPNLAPDDADKAKYVGKIDFPALEGTATTDSNQTVTPSTVGGLPLGFSCAAAADDLYGILVTRDAVTLSAGEDITITLGIDQY